MIFTDYTQKSTMQYGYAQQYRTMKYFRDVLNNWFSDQRNIKDQRLISLLYDKDGNLSENCIRTGTIYGTDGVYAGTTPAVIVGLGDISYQQRSVNKGANPDFLKNPMQAPQKETRYKNIPIEITVITESCDGTILLTQLIQLFLTMNSEAIHYDMNTLSMVCVNGVSRPQAMKPGAEGNAKQLFSSTISVSTMCLLSWTVDTQGPVFNGVKLNKLDIRK